MSPFVSISIDLLLIARCLLGLCWGTFWALVLQHTKMGKFWAQERTWIAVVIGVGADLVIAVGGDWWTCTAVVACSSVGIIARSMINESKHTFALGAYKTIWVLEDSIRLVLDLVAGIQGLLEDGDLSGPSNAELSRMLSLVHDLGDLLRAARRGEYEPRRKR
jgi:hypothetical protein